MKRMLIYTRRRNIRKFDILYFLRNNSTIILLTSINLSAFLIGNIIISQNIINPINILHDNITDAFLWNILYSLICLTVTFCSGLCGVGMIFIYILQFAIGIINGIISSSVFIINNEYSILSYILIYLPSLTILTLIITLSSYISLSTSKIIAEKIFIENEQKINFHKYIKAYSIFMLLAIFASIISAIGYIIIK